MSCLLNFEFQWSWRVPVFPSPACPSNRFGPGCIGVCDCHFRVCNRHDGFCACHSGYTGTTCNERKMRFSLLVSESLLVCRDKQKPFTATEVKHCMSKEGERLCVHPTSKDNYNLFYILWQWNITCTCSQSEKRMSRGTLSLLYTDKQFFFVVVPWKDQKKFNRLTGRSMVNSDCAGFHWPS